MPCSQRIAINALLVRLGVSEASLVILKVKFTNLFKTPDSMMVRSAVPCF